MVLFFGAVLPLFAFTLSVFVVVWVVVVLCFGTTAVIAFAAGGVIANMIDRCSKDKTARLWDNKTFESGAT